jgi:hypothetical protein
MIEIEIVKYLFIANIAPTLICMFCAGISLKMLTEYWKDKKK